MGLHKPSKPSGARQQRRKTGEADVEVRIAG